MKYFLFPLLLVAALQSCMQPGNDMKRDGGLRIRLEASAKELLHDNIRQGDSLATALLDKSSIRPASFINDYFELLQQYDPANAGRHFRNADLAPAASPAACKAFFTKLYMTVTDRLIIILEKRISLYGISRASVTRGADPGQIVVELPGKDFDVFRVHRLLGSSARLEMYETYDNQEVYNLLAGLDRQLAKEDSLHEAASAREPVEKRNTETLRAQLAKQGKETQRYEGLNQKHPLFNYLSVMAGTNAKGEYVLAEGPAVGYAQEKDTARVNRLLRMLPVTQLSGGTLKFMWTAKHDPGAGYTLIAMRVDAAGHAAMRGDIIQEVKVRGDNNGALQISMQMRPEAGLQWQELTRKNIGRSIAIVLDGQVYSYPVVQGEIKRGTSSISGAFTKQEAGDLASVLNSGTFPLPVSIIAEEAVAPEKR